MEIGWIELAQPFQPLPFEQIEGFPLGRDETFVPKLLEGAVEVDDRQTEAIGQLDLRDR